MSLEIRPGLIFSALIDGTGTFMRETGLPAPPVGTTVRVYSVEQGAAGLAEGDRRCIKSSGGKWGTFTLEPPAVASGRVLLKIEKALEEYYPPPELEPPADCVVPMLLWCPQCGKRHLDVGEFRTKPHHTHACQSCGMVWRPAKVNTHGVEFLPGYQNEAT